MHVHKVYAIGIGLLLLTVVFPLAIETANGTEITVGSGTGCHFSTIQEAVNESKSNGGSDTIIIEPGTYDPFIVEGVPDLTLVTNGTVIIKGTDKIEVNVTDQTVNTTVAILNCTGFSMENITVDGEETEQNQTVGIWIQNTSGSIHNCTIYDFVGYDLDEDDQNVTQWACYALAFIESTIDCTNATGTNNQIGALLLNATTSLENATFSGKDNGITVGLFINSGTNITINNTQVHTFNTGNRSAGLYTEEESSNMNLTITNSSIYNNIVGLALMNGTSLQVHNCSIYNNTYGVLGNTTMDVRYNYWGSINGPNCTSNTFNQHQQGEFLEYETKTGYMPWLDASHETGIATAPLTINNETYYINLANALENATSGDAIQVREGQFNQSGNITVQNISTLFINGSTEYGSLFSDISLTFTNVTDLEIYNLSLANETTAGITLVDFDNTIISHVHFQNNTNGLVCTAQGTANTIADTSVLHCIFEECDNGLLLSEATVNDSEIKELIIQNNTFANNIYGINTSNASTDSAYINASNLTIDNNTFYNSINKAIRNWQSEQLDATYNYWFNHQWDTDFVSAGPAGEGLGNGDPIEGNISFSPFYAGHVTVREDEAHNITINNGLDDADITTYFFDWNNNGSFENNTNNPYIMHTFNNPINQTVQLKITGSGSYIGFFQAIVEDNVSYAVKTLTTGYNIIGIIEKEISCAALANKSSTITRICYWNETNQSWSNSYIVGWSEINDPENHHFSAGDEALLTVSTNDSFNLYGFYPTTENTPITIENGLNWMVRTGASITAESLGENLTTDGVDWAQMMYWREGLQEYEDAYYPSGLGNNFAIDPGEAILVIKNATSSKIFTMEGW